MQRKKVASRLIVTVLFALASAGTSLRAHAQTAILGYWAPIYHEDIGERIPGPLPADYAGLPINDAARLRADTWDAELLTLLEHQCKPHPSTYGFRGVGELRVWETRDPRSNELIKYETLIFWQAQHRTIWMDGRPHPSETAPHTWQGFSTGRYEGNTLVVTTTHLKAGWIRRNGVPTSDRVTLEERFYRHGDVLTHVSIVRDPIYLTEPFVRTNGFRMILNGRIAPYPCRPAVEIPRARGEVPSHRPGKNPFIYEVADKFGIPREAMRGGSETALPEYLDRINALKSAGSGGDLHPNLETAPTPR
jgi:hypothetical protein